MSSIKINGVSYSGNNIDIRNGKITIDGRDVTPDDKTIHILVDGDIGTLDVDSCDSVSVSGEVREIKTVSGDVRCSNVTGSVTTVSGDVTCGNIGGNVRTISGDVK